MRQGSAERAMYYRQIRQSLHAEVLPELAGAQAIDTLALIDRLLAQFIVEVEAGDELGTLFGQRLAELLDTGAPTTFANGPEPLAELEARAAKAVEFAASSDNATRREVARQLVEAEREYLEAIDERRQGVFAEDLGPVGPTADNGCSITNEALSGYLRERYPDAPEGCVEQATVIPGGRSKETILVTQTGFSELPERIIVRKDRPVGLLATRAADEFAVIKAVYEHGGVPVPEPLFAEESDDRLGEGTLLVMAWVKGVKAGEFFPDLASPVEYRQEIGQEIAASLAHLHAIPLDRLAETGLDPSGTVVTEESIMHAVDAMVGRITELERPILGHRADGA